MNTWLKRLTKDIVLCVLITPVLLVLIPIIAACAILLIAYDFIKSIFLILFGVYNGLFNWAAYEDIPIKEAFRGSFEDLKTTGYIFDYWGIHSNKSSNQER